MGKRFALDLSVSYPTYLIMMLLPATFPPIDECAPAAYAIKGGEPLKLPVIFASPHSGQYYPQGFQEVLRVPLLDLRRTEDAFVDDLFDTVSNRGAMQISANYARSYVDLNRDARELDGAMFRDGLPRTSGLPGARVRAGLGSLPRIGASGREIYSEKISQAEGAFRLDTIHDNYHAALSQTFEALKQDWADSVLIDCHSMPSVQPGRAALPDIVLGDRFGSSCSAKLTNCVERRFRSLGYSVTRNAPYAGGYTTRRYGRPRRGIHVLQIEINRGLYMDEVNVLPSSNFTALKADLQAVITSILDFAERENA